MEEHNLPIVSFGKYKDKSVLELITDEKYVEWLKLQQWFPKYKQIYNIVVNQTTTNQNNAKTPEHNKLQNLFLEKANQEKILYFLFENNNLINKLSLLFCDKEFINYFGKNDVPLFIPKSHNTEIKFEDRFNWDFVLYYKDIQDFSIVSIPEMELKEKDKYKSEYDIEKAKIYFDEISLCEEKIKIREMIDALELEKFEKSAREYAEKKQENLNELRNYEKEIRDYNSRKENYQCHIFNQICSQFGLVPNLMLKDFKNIRNFLSRKWKNGFSQVSYKKEFSQVSYKKESSENFENIIFKEDQYKILKNIIDDENASEKEKNFVENLFLDKIKDFEKSWEKNNIKPNQIKKMDLPTPFNVNETFYLYGEYNKYEEVLKTRYIDTASFLKREKEKCEKKDNSQYDKIFNNEYEKFRYVYYKNFLARFLDKESYFVNKMDKNQYKCIINFWNMNCCIFCELKPVLGDDYPHVLRKMKTQIELTKTDKNFRRSSKKYVLIVEKFESLHCSKEQLILIFNQANISIIFIDDIFQQDKNTNKSQSNKTLENCIILELKNTILGLEKKINFLEKELLFYKKQTL